MRMAAIPFLNLSLTVTRLYDGDSDDDPHYLLSAYYVLLPSAESQLSMRSASTSSREASSSRSLSSTHLQRLASQLAHSRPAALQPLRLLSRTQAIRAIYRFVTMQPTRQRGIARTSTVDHAHRERTVS